MLQGNSARDFRGSGGDSSRWHPALPALRCLKIEELASLSEGSMANCLVACPAPLSEIKLGKKCSVAQLPHSVFLEGIVNRIFFKLEFKLDLLKNCVNPHSPPPLAMLFPHFMICTVSLHNENCALLQSKFRRGRGVENSVFLPWGSNNFAIDCSLVLYSKRRYFLSNL